MNVEYEDAGEGRRRKLLSEKVDNKDARCNKKYLSGGIERVAMVRGKVGGDLRGERG